MFTFCKKGHRDCDRDTFNPQAASCLHRPQRRVAPAIRRLFRRENQYCPPNDLRVTQREPVKEGHKKREKHVDGPAGPSCCENFLSTGSREPISYRTPKRPDREKKSKGTGDGTIQTAGPLFQPPSWYLMLPFVRIPDVQLSSLAVRADPVAVLAEVHGDHLRTRDQRRDRSSYSRISPYSSHTRGMLHDIPELLSIGLAATNVATASS